MKTITKKAAKKQEAKRMTKRARLEELRAFVGLCFAMLEDKTWDEIADMSGLCRSTIRRLDLSCRSTSPEDSITLATHFGTVQALGIAAGLKLEMNAYSARVILVG